MKELSFDDAIEYLERAIKTEMAIVNLKNAKQAVDETVQKQEKELAEISERPSRDRVYRPSYNPPKKPVMPKEPERHSAVDKFGDHITIFGWMSEIAQASRANDEDRAKYEKKVAECQKAIAEYDDDLAAYEVRYARRKKEYDEKCRKADEKDDKIKREYPKAIEGGKKASEEIESQIQATEEVLQRLYDTDVVFPKYREVVALCSMYEYFLTGRVTSFTGPDGAYNLFESELRQNLIISSIREIGSQLDNIKRNQYTLYTEMKRSNELLQNIESSLDEMAHEVNAIGHLTAINGLLAANIADNLEAVKYIALLN